MIANTVQLIGMFDGQSLGQQLAQWSKIHVDIVQVSHRKERKPERIKG